MAHGKVAVDRLVPTHTLAGDFCRIFAEDMTSLYRLAYLLTGDAEKAESCFRLALNQCLHSVGVFQEWARPWARRAVVQAAIGMMKPARKHFEHTAQMFSVTAGQASGSNQLLEEVVALPAFERFVYVMTVLERFSDQDCKLLLGSTRREILISRLDAMKRLAARHFARPVIRPEETNDVEECRFGVPRFAIPSEANAAVEVEKRIA